MKQNRRTVDQIIVTLRRADVEIGKGKKVPERLACLVLAQPRSTQRYRSRQRPDEPRLLREMRRVAHGPRRTLRSFLHRFLVRGLQAMRSGSQIGFRRPKRRE